MKLVTAVAILVITNLLDTCQSVIMPPPQYAFVQHHEALQASESIKKDRQLAANLTEDEFDEPYRITIVEGSSINIQVESSGFLTICLNRPVPENITVKVSVLSGPNLIHFESQSGDNNYTEITYVKNVYADQRVNFTTNGQAGHAEIVCKIVNQPKTLNVTIDDTDALTSVNIAKSSTLSLIIFVVGWIYFFAWSISFYFQVILNYNRKSVVGLNFDFLALNLLGFTAYTIYNLSLLFSHEVQQNYYEKNAFHRIPVEYNDLFFSAHAVLITLVTISQCFFYERGDQKVSLLAWSFIIASFVISFILYVCHLFSWLGILNVVLFISYVKLAVTLIKYVPQAWMNHTKRSTEGWSILNILLDFTGGLFSLTQMFLLSHNYDDWISIFGNFTKFGLGLFSICFDILFMIQHFVLYKNGQDGSQAQINDSSSYDQASNSEEEEERQRRIQASSGAITQSPNQNQEVYINEDLIA